LLVPEREGREREEGERGGRERGEERERGGEREGRRERGEERGGKREGGGEREMLHNVGWYSGLAWLPHSARDPGLIPGWVSVCVEFVHSACVCARGSPTVRETVLVRVDCPHRR